MKNKLILSLLAALVFGAHSESSAQTLGQCTFVDVATLGDGVGVATSTGIRKVNATVLTKNQRWTRDRVYILAQNVIIPDGITVVIEAGTLIRAERNSLAQGTGTEAPVTPADPGALVVAQGGKLIAVGTADAPIIFTSIDDTNVPGGASTVPPFENKGVVANGTTILNGERALRTGFSTVSGTPGVAEYTISGGTIDTAVAKGYSATWSSTADSAFKHDGLWGGIVLCGKSTVMKNHAALENGRTTSISIPVLDVQTGGIASGTQRGIQFVEGMAGFPLYSYGGGDEEKVPDKWKIITNNHIHTYTCREKTKEAIAKRRMRC